jgi:integrase
LRKIIDTILDGRVTLFKEPYYPPHPMAGKYNDTIQAKYKLKRGVKAKFKSTGRTDIEGARRVATDQAFEYEGRIARGDDNLNDTTFETVARGYLNRLRLECQREDTLDKYDAHKRIIEKVLNPSFGNRPIHLIKASEIIEHNSKRKAKSVQHTYIERGELKSFGSRSRKIRPTTINKENVVIRWVFKAARAQGIIDNIPDIPNEPRKRPEPDFIDHERLPKFLVYLDSWHLELTDPKQVTPRFYREALRDWCKVIIYCGCRTSEASLLKWKDWNPIVEDGIPIAEIAIRAEEAKGRKTGDRKAKGLAQLNDVLEKRRAKVEFNGDNDYIFCHPNTANKRWTGTYIKSFKKGFSQAIKGSGLFTEKEVDTFSPYILRHTFATLAVQRGGANIALLADVMGNSVKVIEDYYLGRKGQTVFKPSLGIDIDTISEK